MSTDFDYRHKMPVIATYTASSFEWTVHQDNPGNIWVVHPDGQEEWAETKDEAAAIVAESMRFKADELSIHEGERISSGLLYAEADDIEAANPTVERLRELQERAES